MGGGHGTFVDAELVVFAVQQRVVELGTTEPHVDIGTGEIRERFWCGAGGDEDAIGVEACGISGGAIGDDHVLLGAGHAGTGVMENGGVAAVGEVGNEDRPSITIARGIEQVVSSAVIGILAIGAGAEVEDAGPDWAAFPCVPHFDGRIFAQGGDQAIGEIDVAVAGAIEDELTVLKLGSCAEGFAVGTADGVFDG